MTSNAISLPFIECASFPAVNVAFPYLSKMEESFKLDGKEGPVSSTWDEVWIEHA
jgi:hypothetical protein